MRANIIDLGQYKYTVNKHNYKDLHFTHPKHLLQPMSLFMVEWRKLILLYETEKIHSMLAILTTRKSIYAKFLHKIIIVELT